MTPFNRSQPLCHKARYGLTPRGFQYRCSAMKHPRIGGKRIQLAETIFLAQVHVLPQLCPILCRYKGIHLRVVSCEGLCSRIRRRVSRH
jgi:hypothetical protein